MGEVVHKVDDSGFNDVLAIDPSEVNGSTCSAHGNVVSEKGKKPEKNPTYQSAEG
jgi:hypothetical protein